MNQQILLIALPLLLSFLSLMIKNKAKELLYLAAILNVAILTIVNKGVTVIGGFEAPFGITLVVDNYSYIGIWIVNVLFLMTLIISKDSIKNYASVLLVAMAGLNGMILTGDIFNLFVFLEITSIKAYILASKNDN
jgi:formate hydrogenlyase subunit 3/multisubunit Na+/H+ antiporter MnhD subunit